jgi:hypothetical protein
MQQQKIFWHLLLLVSLTSSMQVYTAEHKKGSVVKRSASMHSLSGAVAQLLQKCTRPDPAIQKKITGERSRLLAQRDGKKQEKKKRNMQQRTVEMAPLPKVRERRSSCPSLIQGMGAYPCAERFPRIRSASVSSLGQSAHRKALRGFIIYGDDTVYNTVRRNNAGSYTIILKDVEYSITDFMRQEMASDEEIKRKGYGDVRGNWGFTTNGVSFFPIGSSDSTTWWISLHFTEKKEAALSWWKSQGKPNLWEDVRRRGYGGWPILMLGRTKLENVGKQQLVLPEILKNYVPRLRSHVPV